MRVTLISAFLLCAYFPWSLRSHCAIAQSILSIDASSFPETIKNEMLTLISFQAPWCGHCTNFAPELAIAAKKIHEEKINARIGVMDASLPGSKAVLGSEGIDGYPYIAAYRKGVKVGTFGGPRTARDVVNFLRKRAGDACVYISSLTELADFNHEVDVQNNLSGGTIAVVLGLFPIGQRDRLLGLHGTAAQTLAVIAGKIDFLFFCVTDNTAITNHFGVVRDSLLVFTGGEPLLPQGIVPLTPSMTLKDMTFEVMRYSVPLILNFNKQTQPLIHTLPIKMHVLLFYPPVVLTPATPKETAAATSIHRNAAETCSKKDYKNGVCIAPIAATATAAMGKDSDLKIDLEGNTIDAQDGVKGEREGEEEVGVNVQPLRAMEKVVRDSAEKFRGRAIFIRIPHTEASIRQFFGLPQSSHPQIVMADMTDTHDLKRFDFLDYMAQTTEYSFLSDRRKNSDQSETEETIKRFFTAEYISDFVEKVLRGTFLSIVRSESEEVENMPLEDIEVEVEVQEGEIDLVSGHSASTSASPSAENPSTPLKNIEGQTQAQAQAKGAVEGPVVRVVGSNFNARVVKNNAADSFVYFYAPWCAHCKAFEVIFKMLADSLAEDMSVQVVRVDATKNDITHRNVRINAFPTFYFFAVGDQEEPIEYDGERTLESILKFIKAFKSSAATKATATATAAAAAATAIAAAGTAATAVAAAGTAATAVAAGTAGTPPPSKLSLFQMDRGSSGSKSERVNESSDDINIEGEITLTDADAVAVAVE